MTESLRALRHRGPDAQGVAAYRGVVVHGHARLAIIDTDPRSDQPFVYEGALTRGILSFNGECWNYLQLREYLAAYGHVFVTESDTEVVAAAIAEWGIPEALHRIDGQFALAWTYEKSGSTYLARDRLGEVPLYVLSDEASLLGLGSWRWASERRVFGSRGAEAFAFPAGSYARLGDESHSYYKLPDFVRDEASPEHVLELLRAAVRRRLMSDVPIAFLSSGGLDSSLILRLALDEGADVHAYAAFLERHWSDDLQAADRVCEEMGVPLSMVAAPLDDGWVRDAVNRIEISMKAQVEITPLCTALAKVIRADGRKVLLSGEGADELFGGYGNMARKATGDVAWLAARHEQVTKMARGNCVRTNKAFMGSSVEARLPFMDRDLVEYVLPTSLRVCPPHKGLLKEAARLAGVPEWVIARRKETFQGGAGVIERAGALLGGEQLRTYNAMAREIFGGIPRG